MSLSTITESRSLITQLFVVVIGIGAVVAGCAREPVDAPTPPTQALESCALAIPGSSQFRVQCRDLPVPLDPDQPTGSSLLLHVSVVRVRDRRAEPDPLVVLPPMPGEAASMVALTGAALRIHVARDLVLVDQRGTGRSHPLGCQTNDPEALLSGSQRAARLRLCSSTLGVDPRLFTTRAAVADLERVRQALGYARWNLFGQGYGARVAIAYAQSYPEHVRTLLLEGADMAGDAAESNQAALGSAAVEATLAACAQEPACAQVFPDLASETRQLVTDVDAHPRTVALPDPATGSSVSLALTGARVLEASLFSGADPVNAALLPWMLDRASRGDFVPLAAALERLAGERMRLLSEGATFAIRCLEDVPSAGSAAGAEESAVCSSWPAGTPPSAESASAPVDVPTLLLAARGDVVATPAAADRLAERLPRSRQLVLPNQWRLPSRDECLARLTATFVELGTADSLDTRCIGSEPNTRFFVDSTGLER